MCPRHVDDESDSSDEDELLAKQACSSTDVGRH